MTFGFSSLVPSTPNRPIEDEFKALNNYLSVPNFGLEFCFKDGFCSGARFFLEINTSSCMLTLFCSNLFEHKHPAFLVVKLAFLVSFRSLPVWLEEEKKQICRTKLRGDFFCSAALVEMLFSLCPPESCSSRGPSFLFTCAEVSVVIERTREEAMNYP